MTILHGNSNTHAGARRNLRAELRVRGHHAVERINGSVLWANLHLLFWLSLVPFVTGWVSENHFAPGPWRSTAWS
ncbi:MAG TPA: hypothetical protein VHQ02_09755 [Usitatibacter sp.]|nr:hypothetical protein [Usitatibacter sp.]